MLFVKKRYLAKVPGGPDAAYAGNRRLAGRGQELGGRGQNRSFEPEVNIALGVQYLQYLLDLFPTEYAALAAYNGGPSHVKRWLNQGIWDGSWAASQQIPPFGGETRSYVRKVELMRRIYRFLYQAQLEYGKEPGGHEQTD